MPNQTKAHEHLIEEAAVWLARLDATDVSRDERQEFQEWLVQDPSHRQTFEELQALSGNIDFLSGMVRKRPEALSPAFMAALEKCRDFIDAKSKTDPRLKVYRRLTALAASLVVALGATLFWQLRHDSGSSGNGTVPVSYRTAVGERQTVMLADGSVVTLNTDTVLSVVVTATDRRLQLNQGEAYFDVARDSQRPFSVAAGNGIVQAIGTAFNIRYREEQVFVTVYKGEVKVQPGIVGEATPGSGNGSLNEEKSVVAEHILSEGEQIRYGGKGLRVAKLEMPVLDRATSWRDDKLIFDGQSLAAIVDEIQFYIPDRIVIADKGITDLTAGGVFDIDSAESILAALETALPVRVIRRPGIIILTERRSAQDIRGQWGEISNPASM